MVAGAKAAQQQKEKAPLRALLCPLSSVGGEIVLFPFLYCAALAHKLVIILYLQRGFDALSFHLVDTVDVLQVLFLSVTTTQLQRLSSAWYAAAGLADGPQWPLIATQIYSSIYVRSEHAI